MKKYNKPVLEIVSLQSKENIAANAVNPLTASTYTSGNVVTTVYNLSLMAENSGGQ